MTSRPATWCKFNHWEVAAPSRAPRLALHPQSLGSCTVVEHLIVPARNSVGSQFFVLKPRNGSSFKGRCSEKKPFWRCLVGGTDLHLPYAAYMLKCDNMWNAVKSNRRKHGDAGMLPGCFSRRWSPCVWKAKWATLRQWPPMWRRDIPWGQLHQNSKVLKGSP